MQGEGPLLTIAQIAVTLAGFSSVVLALRGSGSGAWARQDRVGLANILAASVGTLFGSLLPFPLTYLGWSNELVWGVTTAVVGVLVLLAVAILTRAAMSAASPPRTPRVFWAFAGSGLVIATMLIFSAFDLLLPRGPSLLLVGLLWALLAAFAQLATFILVTWSSES